jgi:palmitoyltransferase
MARERKHKSVSEIVAESNAKRRARRANQTPPPWIILKLAVFITLGIIVYASYVYIGRLCVPMLRRSPGALGSRTLGSACAPLLLV